jgi:hypothetical protein
MKHTGFRYSMFLIALLILAVAVGMYAYLYTHTGAMVNKTLSDRAVLKTAQDTRLQGTEVLQLHATTADERAQIRTLFVPAEDAVAVIKAIETVGEQSGAEVTISSINATPPGDTKIGKVSASVSIDGTWKQVMQAIALFETLPYNRRMNSLTMRSVDGKSSHWRASFNLVVGTIASK